jgi:sigma-E factor negative regulatory protein RseC
MFGKKNPVCIEHEGIVKSSGINTVTVSISSASACSGCHAAGSCNLSGKVEKVVDVAGSYSFSPGDRVILLLRESAGYKAVLLGYVAPFLLLLTVLIVLLEFSVTELTAGLCAIVSLVPYYLLLWILRKQIGRKFTFTIKD